MNWVLIDSNSITNPSCCRSNCIYINAAMSCIGVGISHRSWLQIIEVPVFTMPTPL